MVRIASTWALTLFRMSVFLDACYNGHRNELLVRVTLSIKLTCASSMHDKIMENTALAPGIEEVSRTALTPFRPATRAAVPASATFFLSTLVNIALNEEGEGELGR